MKLRNTFVEGKLNKDIDERLLPKGQYPHAENIRVINSDGSDIGAVENVRGTEQLTNIVNAANENTITIGSYADDTNQKIYWFNTSPTEDSVYEYDFANNVTTPLLRDTRGVLGFDENYLITGVVKIFNEDLNRDLLIWTDDLNPIRSINIERAKTYGIDGFSDESISLIKTPPLNSPKVQFTFDTRGSQDSLSDKFLAFATRYVYRDGEVSALSPFSYYAFAPTGLDIDYDTLENRGMVNNFNALDITFDTGGEDVVEVELVYKESGSNTVYAVDNFNKNTLASIIDGQPFTYRFINDKLYTALPDDELFRLFDNVPNKAKALDLVGSRLVIGNYEEGFDIVDEAGLEIEPDYKVSIKSQDVEDIQVPYTLSTSSEIASIDFTGVDVGIGSRITFDILLRELDPNTNVLLQDSIYEDELDYIVNEEFDSIEELLRSESFKIFIEDVLTNSFNIRATTTPPQNILGANTVTPYSFTVIGNILNITAPSITYVVDSTPDVLTDNDDPAQREDVIYSWAFQTPTFISYNSVGVLSSIKSLRSYEIGLVYLDKHGRGTTVLTSKTNTINVGADKSTTKNQFEILLESKPPVEAVAYRFAVKQTRGAYDNLFAVTFFREDQFIWVKLEGSDVNKIKVGDTLVVKSDTSGVLEDAPETIVLEISQKDRNFIEGNGYDEDTGELINALEPNHESSIIEPQGVYMKIKPIGFAMNYSPFSTFSELYSRGLDENVPAVTVAPKRGDNLFPISKGASVTLKLRTYIERRLDRTNYEKTFTYISNSSHTSFKDFYISEIGLSDIDIGYGGRFIEVAEREEGINFRSPWTGTRKRRTAFMRVEITINNNNNLVVFETKPENNTNAVFYESAETFKIVDGFHQGDIANQTSTSPAILDLDWYNTFVLGSGVESITYLDGFNNPSLNIDLRPNAVSTKRFSKVRRFADLTYSEPYNENTNINGLNEFNLFRANFKDDIDKKYGSIQKLFTRNTDLVVFQEDKVHKVLFGKDLLMNADGSSNVASIESVLGQHIAFAGEYGISRNPESFSFDANRLYFTDTKRGSVLRLGGNGITEISNSGMRRYFKDEFKDALFIKKVGAFDPYQDQYVLSVTNESIVTPITIKGGGVYRQSNFRGNYSHILDLGLNKGIVTIPYTTNGVPVEIEVVYDGVVYSSGLTTELSGEIIFNKSTTLPTIATLGVRARDCGASITISNQGVDPEPITVTSIVINGEEDEGLERISRYRWLDNGFSSSYRTFGSLFDNNPTITIGGRPATVDVFNVDTGNKGEGVLPIEGSTVRLESINSPNNNNPFNEGDKLGYLLSDTPYSISDINTILDQATYLTPTESTIVNGDATRVIDFVTNSSRYIYLIWDYVLKNESPVGVYDFRATFGQSTLISVIENDFDPDGDDLVVGDIVTQPLFGTVRITEDKKSIEYTMTDNNNNGEGFFDSFTYRAFDGITYSEPTLVEVELF